MKKIALIVGHNEKSKGAYSEGLKATEYDFYGKVLDIMFSKYEKVFGLSESEIAKIKKDTQIFRVPNTGYSKEMAEVVKRINDEKFDIAIELHFNAADKKANGTTVLYWHKSAKGLELANAFQDVMSNATGVKKRALIPIKDSSQNGAYGIMNAKCPYILIEPFFGDSKTDTDKVSADKMADVLFEYLNVLNNVVIPEESKPSIDRNFVIESALKDLRRIQNELAQLLK